MTKDELIKKVKIDFEVVLVEFQVYESSKELFEKEKTNLLVYTTHPSDEELKEEENVFQVNQQWIYASEWYDAEWDD